MRFSAVAVILLGFGAFFSGCAAETPQYQQLSRQQAETIESLNSEIVRLNEEIDETIHSRGSLAKAKAELSKQLADEIASGDLTIVTERKGLVIHFLENALFEPEKVEIRSSAQAALDKIADILMGEFAENKVILEGHTDDAMPSDSGWRSSWEYTGVLSSEVLHYFVDVRGLNPARFEVVSCAEFQKVDPRDTDDGRERNRRVDIVITPQKMTKGG
jgi:chemotaxis protein MotB